MEEPSVLDFVLEKLTFWKESKLSIPELEEDSKPVDPGFDPGESKSWIWKSMLFLLPILFAITAQVFGEPDNRSPVLITFFYVAAALSLILLVLFRNWKVEPLISDQNEAGELTVRWIQFSVGIGISVLAFFFFLGNLFNVINLTLWIAGLVLIWWSLWIPENWWEKFRMGWEDFWQRGFKITPWMILVAAVFLISAFYRFYLLNQVPSIFHLFPQEYWPGSLPNVLDSCSFQGVWYWNFLFEPENWHLLGRFVLLAFYLLVGSGDQE